MSDKLLVCDRFIHIIQGIVVANKCYIHTDSTFFMTSCPGQIFFDLPGRLASRLLFYLN